jgi:1,4-alpha-glucan branching enzyme
VAVICNFVPVARPGYRIGLPAAGAWRQILDTDAQRYGGTRADAPDHILAVPVPLHGLPASAALDLAPLSAIYLEPLY